MTTLSERLAAFPVQTLEIDGRRFSYRTAGSSQPLILLHGIGSGSASWLWQLETLAADFRLIAWDAPGYGVSTAFAASSPVAADYAQALQAFLAGLGLNQVHLIGHSLGAIIATAFARQQPEYLLSLMLADPAIGYGQAEPDVRTDKLKTRLQQMNTLGSAGLAEQRAPALLSAQAGTLALELVRWNMRQLRPDGYTQAAYLLAHADLLADAVHYPQPVLVVCGSEDKITPEAGAQKVAAAFPQGQYEPIKGAGHASYIESPEQFNTAWQSYIERHHESA